MNNVAEDFAFDGKTYVAARDQKRLTGQMFMVWDFMKDGRWRTLQQISEATRQPESSVSARLRDLRKEKFGGHTVNREFMNGGLFRYQLIVRVQGEQNKLF